MQSIIKNEFNAYLNSSQQTLKNIGIDNYKEKWLVDNNSKIFYENTQVGKISKDIVKIIYKKSLN